jgi:dienelactone hydrolase
MNITRCHQVCRRSITERVPYSLFQAIAICLLLSGCGAAQLGTCAPHTKEEGTPTLNWTECFETPFTHAGITHSVFCLNGGTSKPPVLLLHELTGLTPGTLAYAEELSKDFTVYVPLLFGEKGKFSPTSGLWAYWFRGVVDIFPGGEWGIPSRGSTPIVEWLRGVVQKIGERHAQQRLGIIGNCMTGPLPLALLDHPQAGAAVIAQPALPMRLWYYTDADKSSIGLSSDDLRRAQESRAKIYALRFETDCISDRAKLQTLRDQFGDRFLNGEIPTSAYQVDGKPTNAHSTLIGSWKSQDEAGQSSRDARARVRSFLLMELHGSPPERSLTH